MTTKKILCIRPGTGGAFYCENCERDHALVAGLRAIGHSAAPIYMYLPASKKDSAHDKNAPVIFGAVRLYLIDKFPFLKKVPNVLLNLFDSRAILNIAAGFAGSTRAAGHEEMTLEMIKGLDGKFADEFEVAVKDILKFNADVITIPNAFLLGVATAVKAKSPSTKIVCMMQDEHVWTDVFREPFQSEAWRVIANKVREVDVICTHSNWYREKIAPLLNIDIDNISVIPFGVDMRAFSAAQKNNVANDNVSIGYLSRVCAELGADVLADAYCKLLRDNVCGKNSALDFCGGYTKDDLPVVNSSKKKIKLANGNLRFYKNFDTTAKRDFLSAQTVLSVPARTHIAVGGFMIEAMAAGVPMVQPNCGGFAEIINETGAGLLYSENSPDALADTLAKIITNKNTRSTMSAAGVKAVAEKYNNIEMAKQLMELL